MLRWLSALGVLAVTAVLPVSAPAASEFIYWSTGTGLGTGAIGRVANAQGAMPNPSFISGVYGPMNLAVLDNRIFWVQFNSGPGAPAGIGRAFTDGSDVSRTFLNASPSSPTEALTVAYPCPNRAACPDPYIYYGLASGPSTFSVARASIDGTAPNTSYVAAATIGSRQPRALAQKNGPSLSMAWTNMTMNYGVDAITPSAPSTWWSGSGMVIPGLASDGTYVYFGNGSTIDRIRISNGSRDAAFVTGTGDTRGIAVDDDYIYWINNLGASDAIGRVSKADGTTGKSATFIALGGEGFGIAVGNSGNGGSGGGSGDSGGATPTAPAPAATPVSALDVSTTGIRSTTTIVRAGGGPAVSIPCTTATGATLRSCTVKVSVRSSALRQGRAAAGRTTVIGTATTASAAGSSSITVVVRITNARARKALATRGALRATMAITAIGAVGESGTATKTTTLVAPKKAAKAAYRR